MKRLSLLAFFLPPSLRACAVCFSGTSADLARGFYWGVLLLLLLPPVLILGFVGLVAYYVRKNKRLSEPAL